MKKVLVGVLAAAMLSLAAFAGPTIGFGIGWALDTVWGAPSFGVQWAPDGIGLESTIHFAVLELVTGDDFDLGLQGFWEILEVTYPIADLVNGGAVRLIAGFGTPFWLAIDTEELEAFGASLGFVFGACLEGEYGSGIKVLAWYNGDTVGVGANYSYDLLTPYKDKAGE